MLLKRSGQALLAVLVASATAAPSVEKLYVFGDSYSDTGAGYLDGNGPTAVAYLAKRLGFALVPSNTPESASKSLNFAVSGAGTGSGSGRTVKDAFLGRGMQDQAKDFAERVRSRAITFQPESTLFFIAGGLNDRRLTSNETASNLKSVIRTLYGSGGRRFLIALLPTSIPGFSEVSQRLNPVLSRIPTEIRAELPAAALDLSQWGPYFDEVMRNPAQYGIENTKDACAGRAIFNENTTPCVNPVCLVLLPCGAPVDGGT